MAGMAGRSPRRLTRGLHRGNPAAGWALVQAGWEESLPTEAPWRESPSGFCPLPAASVSPSLGRDIEAEVVPRDCGAAPL